MLYTLIKYKNNLKVVFFSVLLQRGEIKRSHQDVWVCIIIYSLFQIDSKTYSYNYINSTYVALFWFFVCGDPYTVSTEPHKRGFPFTPFSKKTYYISIIMYIQQAYVLVNFCMLVSIFCSFRKKMTSSRKHALKVKKNLIIKQYFFAILL